jgi:hypothetical protein
LQGIPQNDREGFFPAEETGSPLMGKAKSKVKIEEINIIMKTKEKDPRSASLLSGFGNGRSEKDSSFPQGGIFRGHQEIKKSPMQKKMSARYHMSQSEKKHEQVKERTLR